MKHFLLKDNGCPCNACFCLYAYERFDYIADKQGIDSAYRWKDDEEKRRGINMRGFQLPL